MIRIKIDIDKLMATDNLIVANNISDYPKIYNEILKALENDIDLSLIIRDKSVQLWIENMSKRNKNSFEILKVNAKSVLENKWDIKIPEYILNNDIIDADLLNINIQVKENESFESVILGYFFDPEFNHKLFPFTKLFEIINSYDSKTWEENMKINLVHKIYNSQINNWISKTKNSNEKEFIKLFNEDLNNLKNDLIKYKILRTFPGIGKKILGDKYTLFESLNLNLRNFKIIEEELSNDLLKGIELEINSWNKPNDTVELGKYIEKTSGLLKLEFNLIKGIIERNPTLVSKDIISLIKTVYNQIIDLIGKDIFDLEKLIIPKKPENPEESWDLEKWLDWVIKSYMPFYAWSDNNNLLKEDLFEIGDRFSSWIYENWVSIKTSSKKMVFNILPNNYNEFKNPDTIDLFIVIDNLSWINIETLKRLLEDIGLGIVKIEPYISMLPSETEISKKCLLSGETRYNDIDIKKYNNIVEKGWIPYFGENKFIYISDITKLKDISKIQHTAYFINYIPLDTALHQSESELGIPHKKLITTLLETLVGYLKEFINKHNILNKVKIHISSDHGSTRIPKELKNDLDINYFKGNEFEKKSNRFVSVNNERFKSLPDNLKYDCFILDKTEFGNSEHYLCARKNNRFIESNGSNYIHGGLLPEEMIVPYIVLEKEKIQIQNPLFSILRNNYRYKAEEVDFEFGNVNDNPIENITFKILNSNIEADIYSLKWIDAKSKTDIKIKARFKKTTIKDDEINLKVLITFQIAGRVYENTYNLPIKMVSMVELKDSTIFDI